jgi:hypothetical protein
MSTFDARDLGEASSYLGISISRDSEEGSHHSGPGEDGRLTPGAERFGLDDGKVKEHPTQPFP